METGSEADFIESIVLEEIVTPNINAENIYVLDRLGCPEIGVSSSALISALDEQLHSLINGIYETFIVKNGKLKVLTPSLMNETLELNKMSENIISVYFTSKFATLKCKSVRIEKISQSFLVLQKLFEELLKNYSDNGGGSFSHEELKIIIALGLIIFNLTHFVDEEFKENAEQAVILILSFTSLQKLVAAFKEIMPLAHKSRLFTLTLYRDLQTIESAIDSYDLDQLAKLKAIMEVAYTRYGDFFLNSYTDELLNTFNQTNLIDCSAALWNKATHGGHSIQTDLGPSFLVNMIKYQWGIIKEFNGIVPDPSNQIILVHSGLENIFEFLNDQMQQLFLLASALNGVLNEEDTTQNTFYTDSDTLTKIYVELMDYIARIVTSLIDNYSVVPQDKEFPIFRVEQMKLLQTTKLYIILTTLCLCNIQMGLTGPLRVSTAPSLNPVLEFYISKVDFTSAIKTYTLSSEFNDEFSKQSLLICSNYSMIRGLSRSVLDYLEGLSTKKGALDTELSWNMLSFALFMIALLLMQTVWFVKAILALVDDYFWY